LLAGRTDMPTKFFQPSYLRLWLFLGLAGSVTLALFVIVLPLRGGLKSFRRLEV
jgi:hypothetical protein